MTVLNTAHRWLSLKMAPYHLTEFNQHMGQWCLVGCALPYPGLGLAQAYGTLIHALVDLIVTNKMVGVGQNITVTTGPHKICLDRKFLV
jgi:hypothetical protein